MKSFRGFSGSTLKLIAVATMIIDHVGLAIVARLLRLYGTADGAAFAPFYGLFGSYAAFYRFYRILRGIGRIAFPIYCFLLVEGFRHTRDGKRYALRLALFALVSEVPFDLAFKAKVLEFQYQNVFFTLCIGLLTIMGLHFVEERQNLSVIPRTIGMVLIAWAGMGLAWLLRTDYGAFGVLCILLFYYFREKKQMQLLTSGLVFVWREPPAAFAFLPIALYNGTRGMKLKYFFYIIYPAHLLILYLISAALGMSGIAVT